MKYTVNDPADVTPSLSKHSSIPSDSGMKVTTCKLPQPNNTFSEAIAGITDRCLFWFSVWGWGGYLGHKGGPGSVVIHRAFVCCLFKRNMVYAFTNAPL